MITAAPRHGGNRLGGSADTALRLAGPDDRAATVTSRGTHHHELGRRLAPSDTAALRDEGCIR